MIVNYLRKTGLLRNNSNKENTQKEVNVSSSSEVNTTEIIAAKIDNSAIRVSKNENVITAKSKVIIALENKVEKVTSVLRKQTTLNNTSNSSSSTTDDMMILLIVLAIIIPFVAVGIYTDWDSTKVLISILLMILFYIPGIVYALLTIFDKI